MQALGEFYQFWISQKLGNLSQDDCYETFNMGIGMVLAVSEDKLESVKKLGDKNEDFYIIGNLRKRKGNEEKSLYIKEHR